MAKLELVKETRINGTVQYSLELDGKYVSRSVSNDLEEVERFFKIVSQTGNLDTIREIIKSTEINENKAD
jgi:translation initiation factor 2 beta subunit (eIF-2beta)/eIF-5